MERTIDGKALNEVFQALKEDIPDVVRHMEDNGQPYLNIEVLRKFFEQHIPVKNYGFDVLDLQLCQYDTAACFTCIGRMTIYDDSGKMVVEKSHIGSYNCQKTANGKVVDMAMAAKNAAIAARKNCITMFGCGERQLNLEKAKRKGRNTGNRKDPKESRHMPEVGKGDFLLQYDSQKKVVDTPKLLLVPVICLDHENYWTRLLIWKNNKPDIKKLVDWIMQGKPFSCKGKFERYNDEFRIVFENLSGGAG